MTPATGAGRGDQDRPNRLRVVVSVAVSSTLVLSGAGLMLAFPGEAAPLPTSYSARTSADLWRINAFDADLSDGTPATATEVSVLQVGGLVGSTTDPRSHGEAYNLAGSTADGQGARRRVVSSARPGADTAGPTAGIAPSGVIADLLSVTESTLAARARWVGDRRCLTTADGLVDASATGGGASLAPSVVPSGSVLPPVVVGGATDLPTALPTQTASGLPTSLPTSATTSASSTALPTQLPTELPTSATTSVLPTALPTSGTPLPTVPPTATTSLPTVSPTTSSPLPTLPPLPGTTAPTVTATPSVTPSLTLSPSLTILPPLTSSLTTSLSVPPVTPGLPGLRQQAAAATDGGLVLAAAGAGSVRSRTDLPVQNDATADVRGVRAQTIGTVADTSAPAMTFFGGEVEVRITREARLTAYADGRHPSVVAWSPPTVTVTLAGQPTAYVLPAGGTPLVVGYSQNSDVRLTLTAGQLTTTAESPTGLVAAGAASVLRMVVRQGTAVALDADFMPMTAEARAPAGGIACPLPDSDGDGLHDALENTLGTDEHDRDTDDDGLGDGREHLRFHTDPRRADTDRDGLKDGAEVKRYQTNPRRKDTDGDGVSDGVEVRRGTNPLRT